MKYTKCKNEKCGDYNPLCMSGCYEYNMRSVSKCEHFKAEYDIEEIDENYDETLGDTE